MPTLIQTKKRSLKKTIFPNARNTVTVSCEKHYYYCLSKFENIFQMLMNKWNYNTQYRFVLGISKNFLIIRASYQGDPLTNSS